MRNNSDSTIFSMSSLLESRSDLLHLRTPWIDSEPSQTFHKLRLDALSIPHYKIKKGRCHGARHGKTEEQKEYHIYIYSLELVEEMLQKSWRQGEHYEGIHDRFLRDQVYRDSQLKKWLDRAEVHPKWISWHRRITPTVQRWIPEIKNNGISH